MERIKFRHAPLAAAVALTVLVPAKASLLEIPSPAIDVYQVDSQHVLTGYDVVTLPEGQFGVLWSEHDDDLYSYDYVKLQRFDQNGEPLGEEITVYQVVGYASTRQPVIAADETGRMAVAWAIDENLEIDTDGCDDRIEIARISQDGTVDNVSVDIDSGCRPDIAMDADGDIALVWQVGEGIRRRAKLQTFLADGAEYSEVNGLGQKEPSVVFSSDGTLLAGWNQRGRPRGQRFSLDGTRLGDEFRVDTDITYSDSSTILDTLTVAADAEGGFVAFWNQIQPNIDVDEDRLTKRGQRWHSDGTPGAELKFGDSEPDGRYPYGVVGDATFSANAQGDVAAVWIRHAEDELPEPKITLIDGTNTVIDNERLFVSDDELSVTTQLGQPQVALHNEGAVLVWSQREEDGPETLRARVFKAPPPPPEEPEEEPDDDVVEEEAPASNDDNDSNGSGGSGGLVLGILMTLAGALRWHTRKGGIR